MQRPTGYLIKAILLPLCIAILGGCPGMRPQIMPQSDGGFGENEFLIVKARGIDELGLLYEAIPETDNKGKPLPLRYRDTMHVLLPKSDNWNKREEMPFEQERYALIRLL